MNDNKVKKISLLVAVAGIIIIYISTILAAPWQPQIASISEQDSGKIATISGSIMEYSTSNGNIFLLMTDGSGNITVVMFERTARGTHEMKKGDNITVEGQISIYKNELEVIASSIKAV